MRIVVDRGTNTGAIVNYLHRQDKRAAGKEQDDPVFHTNLFGRDALERTEELRFSADLNQKVERTYIHYKVSFPPGEDPDIETKKGIVDDLLNAREHGQNCQFFAVEHYEKIDKHNVHHLHILTSSVRLDGSWVDDAYERVKLKQVERDIEQKWGLQYCPPKEKGKQNSEPIREVKLREKLQAQGQVLDKDELRRAIDLAVQDKPSMALLFTRLKAQSLSVQFHEFEDGKGISYGIHKRAFRGRDLGDRYSFEGLYRYAGVDYQPLRDDPMLRELNRMTVEQCQKVLEPLQSQKNSVSQNSTNLDWWKQLRQLELEEAEEEQEKVRQQQKLRQKQEQELRADLEQQTSSTPIRHSSGPELE